MNPPASHRLGPGPILRAAARLLGRLLVLLLAIATFLFFMLQFTGDPALVLAGSEASADQVAAIRTSYGFDRPLPIQYLSYLWATLRFDFGRSLMSGEPAMNLVLEALPVTLLLTVSGMAVTLAAAVPAGAIIGYGNARGRARGATMVLFLLQGIPGYIAALLLVQVFAIELNWLPAVGFSGPASWVLPCLSIAAFLVPKLARIIARGVEDAMKADFIRTARSSGVSERRILWQHALPNALAGATALIGAQLAFLISGLVVIETLFAWPGLGRLIVEATLELDFPVVQAATLLIAVLVFAVNSGTDLLLARIDVRIHEARQ